MAKTPQLTTEHLVHVDQEAPKKRLGRPPSKRKKRPEVLPMFKVRRMRTDEEKGIIVGVIISNPNMSMIDISYMVNTPVRSCTRWFQEFLERQKAQQS